MILLLIHECHLTDDIVVDGRPMLSTLHVRMVRSLSEYSALTLAKHSIVRPPSVAHAIPHDIETYTQHTLTDIHYMITLLAPPTTYITRHHVAFRCGNSLALLNMSTVTFGK